MKKLNFSCFVYISCLFLVLIVYQTSGKECGDPECKLPIAEGYAQIRYMSGSGDKVNLKQGEKLKILARNVGKDKDFFVRKEDGKEGLASTKIVRELKVLIKQEARHIIQDDIVPNINPTETYSHDVVDGTIVNKQEDLQNETETTQSDTPTSSPPKDSEQNAIDTKTQLDTDKPIEEKELSLPEDHPEIVDNNDDEEDDEDVAVDELDDDEDEEDVSSEVNSVSDSSDVLSAHADTTETQNRSPDSAKENSTEPINIDFAEAGKTVSEGNNDSVSNTEEEDSEPNEAVVQNQVADTLESQNETEIIEVDKDTSINNTDSSAQVTVTQIPVEQEIDTTETLDITTPMPTVQESILDTHPLGENDTNEQVISDTTANIGNTISETGELAVESEDMKSSDAQSTQTSQEVVEEKGSVESNLPQPPHGILRGGFGNLMSHAHHHHHHHHNHGHGNGHHHHHNHHHHEHQHHLHSHEDHLHAKDEHTHPHVGTGQIHVEGINTEKPFLEELLPGSPEDLLRQQVVNKHPETGRADHNKNEIEEDGFCDQQSCPPGNPTHTLPQQQRANGFHHPMVSGPQITDAIMSEHGAQSDKPLPQEENLPTDYTSESAEDDMDYAKMFVLELFKLSDLILLLGITSFTLIAFSLGHYLINKNRKEKPLIYKLNMVERDLMASQKENAMLKCDLTETKHKLTSIENNSFGSNDMVIALRQELEDAEQTKCELQEQISSLEKELENAAEAGLELNKMVAELLNQSGSDSIALSVDELQKQLNEQQQTILSMNTTLADKSRENSELQITLANQTAKFTQDMEDLQQALNDLKLEKNNIEIELNNLKANQSSQLESFKRDTAGEIAKLNKEVKHFQVKWEDSKKALSASEAKVEALEECIKDIKRGSTNGTVDGLIDSAEQKAQLVVLNKEKVHLQERLQGEIVARQLLDDHVKMINEEISTLKKEYSQAEKDKLEAETRLEVLSSYFKDKETQLQKELSIKEAMWMQQQGETTSTVERIRLLQDEKQQLKSQNDKLRAEIEAQATAHKAQYSALETRSHDAWLAARQAERRLEEARNESTALRRKLTALGDVSVTNTTTDGLIPNAVPPPDLNPTAPSPIRVESPHAPMMGLPPPPFIPPPFAPFMPPFMPPPAPGEMRPAPLGRLMSPPPNRYSPSMIDNRDRYSPERGRYSPDSHYGYSVVSNYETETDFSPPPSPPPHSRRSNYDRDRDNRSDRDRDRDHDMRDRERDMRERDGRTSGSGGGPERTGGAGGAGYPKAFSPPGMRTTSPPIQDPRNKKYQGSSNHYSDDDFDEW